MKITETNLAFNGTPKKRSSTKRIIVHHSASSDVSAATIHGWHLNQGWLGVGYQFVIRADGTVERGRPEWSIGSHSGPGGNGDSVGVCLTGNFETGTPAEAQLNSLVELIKYLRGKYGNLDVIGHKDVMATACPGKYFPLDKIKQLAGGGEMVTGPVQDWEVKAVQTALQKGIITQLHDPRETIQYGEFCAMLLNMMAKLGGK